MALHGKHVVDRACDDAALRDLIARADILFRGPDPLPAALAPEMLAARYPGLSDFAVLPFDADGANVERPATALPIMARSGLMPIVGAPDRPPLTLPGRRAWALGKPSPKRGSRPKPRRS